MIYSTMFLFCSGLLIFLIIIDGYKTIKKLDKEFSDSQKRWDKIIDDLKQQGEELEKLRQKQKELRND